MNGLEFKLSDLWLTWDGLKEWWLFLGQHEVIRLPYNGYGLKKFNSTVRV